VEVHWQATDAKRYKLVEYRIGVGQAGAVDWLRVNGTWMLGERVFMAYGFTVETRISIRGAKSRVRLFRVNA